MASTTAEPKGTSSNVTNDAGCEAGIGLRVLNDLIRLTRAPGTEAEEHAALLALDLLYRGHDLPAPLQAHKQDLARCLQASGSLGLQRLLHWIEHPRVRLPLAGRWRRPRRDRHLLLLLMLTKSIAPLMESEALPLLHQLGLFGSPEKLDMLLRSLSGRVFAPPPDLAARYLRSVSSILGEDAQNTMVERMSARAFAASPWPRQLRWLVSRAQGGAAAKPGRASSPIHRADTLEFRLARAGAFRRLGRCGGRLARQVLAELGYQDYRSGHATWPWPRVALTLILVTLVVLVALYQQRRTNQWITQSLDTIRASHRGTS